MKRGVRPDRKRRAADDGQPGPGRHHGSTTPSSTARKLTVLATRNSTAADFGRIISLIESGTVDTTPWITHRAGFDGMIGEFENWLDPEFGVIKAIVEVG